MFRYIFADAGDDGFSFILPATHVVARSGAAAAGGLARRSDHGHLVAIAGRGGTGKSVLALQLVTGLLREAATRKTDAAAFYFSLEASPFELATQLGQFTFGKRMYYQPEATVEPGETVASPGDDSGPVIAPEDLSWARRGLHIHAVPSPPDSLASLILQVRQTIAGTIATNVGRQVQELAAIVIDPLGGLRFRSTLASDMNTLKQLADSHRTFVFVLVEEHIYNECRAIEHYSQTILHLSYEPAVQPARRIFVQKARSQAFRPGYHQLDLDSNGIVMYPSVEAQSDYAHLRKDAASEERVAAADLGNAGSEKKPFVTLAGFSHLQRISDGAVIFLMGPPGTFKQYIATNFATAVGDAATLYISFKAERSAVEKYTGAGVRVADAPRLKEPLFDDADVVKELATGGAKVWFVDARSPLSTPQVILSRVRRLITSKPTTLPIRRAVVWGLRRLADMPNFSGGTAVQFLEALVTLLQAEAVTCLLVDWPDVQEGNTLPIVDLSQYILVTRQGKSRQELASSGLDEISQQAWGGAENSQTVMLRVQRDDQGFHRDIGLLLHKAKGRTEPECRDPGSEFESLWHQAFEKWEKDPGLG